MKPIKVEIINIKLARKIGRVLMVDPRTAVQLVEQGTATYIDKPPPQKKNPITTKELEVIEPLKNGKVENQGQENEQNSEMRDTGQRFKKPAKIVHSGV